jgi:hypothetical protein
MDLIHDGHITVVDDKVVAGADTGQPWCDAILARIRRMPIPQGIGYWVISVGAPPFRAQDRVTWRLIERGLVRLDVRSMLGVFSSTRFVVARPDVRDAIRARVATAMATDGSVDAQTVSLIAMAAASGRPHRLIAGQPRMAARRRMLAILRPTNLRLAKQSSRQNSYPLQPSRCTRRYSREATVAAVAAMGAVTVVTKWAPARGATTSH